MLERSSDTPVVRATHATATDRASPGVVTVDRVVTVDQIQVGETTTGSMELAEATWTEIDDATPAVALVPVGSTEQHGPHAPLGTDTITARAVARAGAEPFPDPIHEDTSSDDATPSEEDTSSDDTTLSDEDTSDPIVTVTPAIPIGVSEEHRRFAGTAWVSPDTFRAYCRETVESLATHGIDRVVFVNGHGGNTEALAELARRLSRDGTAYSVVFTYFEAIDADDMGHAGPVETALLRHTTDLVREDQIETAREGAADAWGEWCHGVALAHDSDEFTDNGVVGDPTAGDAERGERLLDRAGDALADLVRRVHNRPFPKTQPDGKAHPDGESETHPDRED